MDGNYISLLHEPTKRHHASTKSCVDNQILSSETDILQQADVTISDAVRNHANILDRQIITKSLNLKPEGIATKYLSMGGQYHIVGLPDPQLQDETINLKTLNRKIQSELEINNQLESLKYVRLDVQNQMVSNLSMNNHEIVSLSPPTMSDHAVNKQFLDDTVNGLARDLTTENRR